MSSDNERLAQYLTSARDLIRWGASRFQEAGLCFGHGTDNALDEAAQLVRHALALPLTLPNEYLDAVLLPEERLKAIALLRRREEERTPVAYLTGEAVFAGLRFIVDERVLVPRSPIAELVQQRFEPWLDGREPGRILDMCTGSGCIAIACALTFEHVAVDAVDLSSDALAVAAANVRRHDVEDRVRLFAGDLFAPLGDRRYDLIISNPPYVDAADMAVLPPEYRHEPALGLAAGEDGLDIAMRLLCEAGGHLTEDGLMVVEVGRSAERLIERLPELPFNWLEFEHGGDGVFAIYADELRVWSETQGENSHAH